MSAADLAAVILAAVALVAVAALAVVCTVLVRTTRQLRDAVDRFESTTGPAADRLADAAHHAAREVDRLDSLIGTASSIGHTVDAASQLTLKALANPVIKGAAIASGTSRAARRLRTRDRDHQRQGA